MTILGIDYGERRIGLAITDALEIIASPLETVPNEAGAIERIRRVVEERKVDTVVVGMPLKMDGTVGPAAENTMVFVEKLKAALTVAIDTFDERLTTAQAHRAMLQHDVSRAKRAKRVDEMAAQIILQSYMDSGKRRKARSENE